MVEIIGVQPRLITIEHFDNNIETMLNWRSALTPTNKRVHHFEGFYPLVSKSHFARGDSCINLRHPRWVVTWHLVTCTNLTFCNFCSNEGKAFHSLYTNMNKKVTTSIDSTVPNITCFQAEEEHTSKLGLSPPPHPLSLSLFYYFLQARSSRSYQLTQLPSVQQ